MRQGRAYSGRGAAGAAAEGWPRCAPRIAMADTRLPVPPSFALSSCVWPQFHLPGDFTAREAMWGAVYVGEVAAFYWLGEMVGRRQIRPN